jgi:hypothetical protein
LDEIEQEKRLSNSGGWSTRMYRRSGKCEVNQNPNRLSNENFKKMNKKYIASEGRYSWNGYSTFFKLEIEYLTWAYKLQLQTDK